MRLYKRRITILVLLNFILLLQVSTLRFATRMMCVASEPAMNEIIDPVVSSMSYIEPQIPLVKQELITLLEHLSSSPVISGVQVT